jgi:ribonuclease D
MIARQLAEVAPPITTKDRLTVLCSAIEDSSVVALDTEFIRERTYYPQLCLIQIATEDFVGCIDCLADLDLQPLIAALFDEKLTWVLHSARQDLEVIWNMSARMPRWLIDTQMAGALVGFPPQQSLQDLLQEVLNVRIEKDLSRTDWTRRPLPEPALRYALDDVRFLIPAWHALSTMLGPRSDWLEEDCQRMIAKPPTAAAGDILERLRGAGSLDRDELAAAIAVIIWREREAQKLDRPRRWIISDEQLLDIARMRPANSAELARIPSLPRKLASRSGAAIIDALTSRESEATAEILAARDRQTRPDRAVLKSLQSDIKRRADRLGIYPAILATRRDLSALASGNPPPNCSEGWRKEILGKD